MLVDVTFNADKVNEEFKDRGVSFKSETISEDGRDFTVYSYKYDPNHEFWKSKKHNPGDEEVRYAIREGKGIYWGWNFEHMINDYFVENVDDSFAMFSDDGDACTRDKLRALINKMSEDDISDEEHEMAHQEYFKYNKAAYGTADTVQQVLAYFERAIANPNTKLLLCFHKVKRSEQSESGGWRWHKNGEYIGTKQPQHEYLYDDVHIDEIVQYHAYIIS